MAETLDWLGHGEIVVASHLRDPSAGEKQPISPSTAEGRLGRENLVFT